MADLVSNGELFIDFGATAGGSGGGALQLEHVTNIRDADGKSVEVKKAIGVKGGAGVIHKEGGGTITLSELRHNPPQVRWRRLRDERKWFTLTLQDEDGGLRQKWLRCKVSKVDRGADEEGNHTDEIEIVYLSSVESQ